MIRGQRWRGSYLTLVVQLEDFPAFLFQDTHVVLGDLFLSVYYPFFEEFVGEAVGHTGGIHVLLCPPLGLRGSLLL